MDRSQASPTTAESVACSHGLLAGRAPLRWLDESYGRKRRRQNGALLLGILACGAVMADEPEFLLGGN